ncbi:MAG: SDR family NAD(P)-dependent oxidoreductase [Candidatus Aminicenantaceae bacterium]
MNDHRLSHYTLITGGSEGLGKALAGEWAARGMNLVIAALSDEKLRKIAALAINKMLQRKPVIIPGRFNRFLFFSEKILPEPLKLSILYLELRKELTAGKKDLS